MTTEDRLAVVDDLLALPFPGEGTREGRRSSGPGHHVCVLQASRDFWDDRSEETVEAAEEEIDTALQALVATLTTRWGEPETIDLWPYLRGEDPAPEPMITLCQLSGTMLLWRLETGRWIALAVGQADPEFPIELLAAVAEAPIPTPPDQTRRRSVLTPRGSTSSITR
ncbi:MULTISPECIES: hypothetical protein [Streptosporangium]|uniref:Uncharacterized protein n=1 Tax=Streptosporangium brasiliense TaxID=47480 RepID=A0ABT9R5A0_9ACTN|nr:hypothetical protein [Streptosporangium brasiliense]MDP9864323.1 hypothetical protein [Streptosporangium brasiliense]